MEYIGRGIAVLGVWGGIAFLANIFISHNLMGGFGGILIVALGVFLTIGIFWE